MNLTTKKEEHVQTGMGIWAIPKSTFEPGDFPFTFELYHNASYHWRDAAVFVAEANIAFTVPAGINLLAKAHETLDLKEKNALDSYTSRMEDIAKERKSLALLTHMPEGEFVNEL